MGTELHWDGDDIADLVGRLGGGDTLEVRENAERAIRALNRQTAIPAILPLLQDQSGELRVNAAEALLILDSNSTLEWVIPLLGDQLDSVRWNVCHFLCWHGDKRAVEALGRVLRFDLEPDVRAMAAQALGVLGDDRAIPILTYAISNDQGADHEGVLISEIATNSRQRLLSSDSKDDWRCSNQTSMFPCRGWCFRCGWHGGTKPNERMQLTWLTGAPSQCRPRFTYVPSGNAASAHPPRS